MQIRQTGQHTAGSAITTKIPPLDGELFNQESLSNRRSQVFQRYVETPLQRSSECVLLEILTIYPSKRRHRDGQVDLQVLIALETLKGFLDGHAADVDPERRAKTKPVSCRRGSTGC